MARRCSDLNLLDCNCFPDLKELEGFDCLVLEELDCPEGGDGRGRLLHLRSRRRQTGKAPSAAPVAAHHRRRPIRRAAPPPPPPPAALPATGVSIRRFPNGGAKLRRDERRRRRGWERLGSTCEGRPGRQRPTRQTCRDFMAALGLMPAQVDDDDATPRRNGNYFFISTLFSKHNFGQYFYQLKTNQRCHYFYRAIVFDIYYFCYSAN